MARYKRRGPVEDQSRMRCSNLREEAERIRQRRYFDRQANPGRFSLENTYTYTQEEMFTKVYGYRTLVEGRRLTQPGLEMIAEIVEYLSCSVKEHSALLVAAGYAPIGLDAEGEELNQAIKSMKATLDILPLPGYIVTRDWVIHAVNPYILRLLDLREDTAKILLEQGVTVLDFIFNPLFKTRERLDCASGEWERTARRNLYGFQLNNQLTQQTPGFRKTYDRIANLPDSLNFRRLWNETRPHLFDRSPFAEVDYITRMRVANGSIITFRSLHIHHGDLHYPSIIAYLPIGDESLEAYRNLGIPVL